MPGEATRPIGLAGTGSLARIAGERLVRAAIEHRVIPCGDDAAAHPASGAALPLHRADGPAWFDGNVLVTAFPGPARLQHFLDALLREAKPRDRPLHLLDLTPMSPKIMRDLSTQCRAAGIVACGASLPAAGLPGAGATLYVDRDALDLQPLAGVLEALGQRIVPTGPAGSAKAVATIVELVVAVNAAVVREAFALAASVGIDAVALGALLSKGSGANAVIAGAAGSSADDDAPVASRLAQLQGMLADATRVAREVDHPAFFAALGIASLSSAATAGSRGIPSQSPAAASACVGAR